MDKSINIINFYIWANRLKEKIRTGWIDIEVKKERLESVAEHIYGTLIIAIAINSEYDLELDMYKVLKMLTLHELEEILMPDYSVRANITRTEKIKQGKECVHIVTKDLLKQTEIEDLLNEFNDRNTRESVFAYHIDKIECDLQLKIYDLQGTVKFDKIKQDLEFYGDRANQIEKLSKNPSDIWIEYDRPIYKDDAIFNDLIEKIKNLKEL